MAKKWFIIGLAICLIVGISTATYTQYSRPEIAKMKGIGNCHSYTYWQLTGEIKRDITYTALLTILKNKYLYKEIRLPAHRDYDAVVKLEPGDVVTFGTAHSGFVSYPGRISHLRKTQFQNILHADGSIYANTAITIPIDPKRLWSYPHDYIAYLRKQGVRQEEIDKKRYENPPSIGFYHPLDTIKDIKNIPAYSQLPVSVWKQPEKLEIYPQEKKIPENGKAYFKAHLNYEHSSEIIDADILTPVYWQPEFVDEGTVSGKRAGVGRHQIKAVALKIPKPWGLHDKFVQEAYMGHLFHKKYEDTATLIVEMQTSLSEDIQSPYADYIIGTWCRSGHCVKFYKVGADTYEAKITVVGPLEPYHFTLHEITFRNIKYVGDSKYKGEVKWRWTNGGQKWEPVTLTIKGNTMEGVGTWTRQVDIIS